MIVDNGGKLTSSTMPFTKDHVNEWKVLRCSTGRKLGKFVSGSGRRSCVGHFFRSYWTKELSLGKRQISNSGYRCRLSCDASPIRAANLRHRPPFCLGIRGLALSRNPAETEQTVRLFSEIAARSNIIPTHVDSPSAPMAQI